DRNFIVDLSCEREHRVECVVQYGSHLDEEIGAASTKSIARAGGGDRLLQVIHLIARFHYHVDAAEPESVDGCFESAPAEGADHIARRARFANVPDQIEPARGRPSKIDIDEDDGKTLGTDALPRLGIG